MNTYDSIVIGKCEHCGKAIYSMRDFPEYQPREAVAIEFSKSKDMLVGIGAYGSTKADFSMVYIVDPALYCKCQFTINEKKKKRVPKDHRVAFICDDCVCNSSLCTIVDNEYKTISKYSDSNDLFTRTIADNLRDEDIIKDHLYQPIPEDYICLNSITDYDKIVPTIKSFFGSMLNNFWVIDADNSAINLYPIDYEEDTEWTPNNDQTLTDKYKKVVLYHCGINITKDKDETVILTSDKCYIYKLPTNVFRRLFCYKAV